MTLFHPRLRERAAQLLARAAGPLLLALCSLLPGFAAANPDQAKGATPWAMVLCTYPGVGVRPDWQPVNFATLFVPGTGGVTDYFRDVSYGSVDLSGSRVYGWFNLPYAPAEAQRVVAKDASITAGSTTLVSPNAGFHASDVGKQVWIGNVLPADTTITSVLSASTVVLSAAATANASGVDVKVTLSREQLLEDCLKVAEPQVHFPDFYGVIAVRNDGFDSDSTGRPSLNLNGQRKAYGAVLLNTDAGSLGLNMTHIAHEMLHGYGLEHSYGDPAPYCNNEPSGVYCDPWDIMSAMLVNGFSGNFGMSAGWWGQPISGPGMNAGMLDLMGWLPPARRTAWNGGAAMNLQLAPLSHPEWQGTLAAVVPLPDSTSHYYVVELRAADRWDRGFALTDTSTHLTALPWLAGSPSARVFVHEVKVGSDGQPHTWIKKGFTPNCASQYDLPSGGFFKDMVSGVVVDVTAITTDASAATVTVRQASATDGARCAQLPPPTPTGYSGGTGSLDACTTCGPGGKTPPKPIRFQ